MTFTRVNIQLGRLGLSLGWTPYRVAQTGTLGFKFSSEVWLWPRGSYLPRDRFPRFSIYRKPVPE